MDAGRALRIWGLCHQLRLDEDDSAITKAGRRADRLASIRHDRDMLIEFYSQYQAGQRAGQLTPKASERVRAVKARCDNEIKRIRSIGFTAPVLSTNDAYIRGPKSLKPQVDPESGVALVFILVEDYLARRPMQRAFAKWVYVDGKSVASFRYVEYRPDREVLVCGSRRGAFRVARGLKERLGTIFE